MNKEQKTDLDYDRIETTWFEQIGKNIEVKIKFIDGKKHWWSKIHQKWLLDS